MIHGDRELVVGSPTLYDVSPQYTWVPAAGTQVYVPLARLTTGYGVPPAPAEYDGVPLWLTCEDSGPS